MTTTEPRPDLQVGLDFSSILCLVGSPYRVTDVEFGPDRLSRAVIETPFSHVGPANERLVFTARPLETDASQWLLSDAGRTVAHYWPDLGRDDPPNDIRERFNLLDLQISLADNVLYTVIDDVDFIGAIHRYVKFLVMLAGICEAEVLDLSDVDLGADGGPIATIRAERGLVRESDDRWVAVFLTHTRLVVRIGEVCHLFGILPDLDYEGTKPSSYVPEVSPGITEVQIPADDVIEGDGFLLSFGVNMPSGRDVLFVTTSGEDWTFELDGLTPVGVFHSTRRVGETPA